MYLTLWINTFVSVVGVLLGIFFASGSIISIADMQVSWAGALLVAALFVPVAFAVSGIGAWLAHWLGAPQLISYLVAFPWVYLVAFVAAMLISFKLL